jgi:hypothetical protein
LPRHSLRITRNRPKGDREGSKEQPRPSAPRSVREHPGGKANQGANREASQGWRPGPRPESRVRVQAVGREQACDGTRRAPRDQQECRREPIKRRRFCRIAGQRGKQPPSSWQSAQDTPAKEACQGDKPAAVAQVTACLEHRGD